MTTIIETERLILRTWKEEDAETYFQINKDSKVIEFVLGLSTLDKINDFIHAVNNHGDKHGYTLWAACLKETGELIGSIGLHYIDWESHFTPAVEVAWRLGSQYWGKGYATEGAKAALDYGFKQCDLREIVSFAAPANIRSIHVMEKIGLKRDLNGDFLHPEFQPDSKLAHHVLYRLKADEYLRGDRNG
jgi:RimJ/RimL family protein N-acetyltransferase